MKEGQKKEKARKRTVFIEDMVIGILGCAATTIITMRIASNLNLTI